MMDEVVLVTDSATICVFDLASLRHRLEDDGDWWTVTDEGLLEVNEGNVAFVGLQEDGKYTVEISETLHGEDCTLVLNCPSGRVFLGAGEEVTGNGFEPEAIRGGTFLTVDPGRYRWGFRRKSERVIAVSFRPTEEGAKNVFTAPIRI